MIETKKITYIDIDIEMRLYFPIHLKTKQYFSESSVEKFIWSEDQNVKTLVSILGS